MAGNLKLKILTNLTNCKKNLIAKFDIWTFLCSVEVGTHVEHIFPTKEFERNENLYPTETFFTVLCEFLDASNNFIGSLIFATREKLYMYKFQWINNWRTRGPVWSEALILAPRFSRVKMIGVTRRGEGSWHSRDSSSSIRNIPPKVIETLLSNISWAHKSTANRL